MHEGRFKETADRAALKPVLEAFLTEKLKEFLRSKKMNHFRYFKARYECITGGSPRTRNLEEFLIDFRFEKRLRQTSGIGPVTCAVLSGDIGMVHQLLAKRACLNCKAPNIMELDIIPGLTPLQFAAKHSCDPATIAALLEGKADINQTDSLGTSVVGHAGTPEVVQLLIDRRADLNQRKGPFGMPALTACILRPLVPEGLSLMIQGRAEVNSGAGMYALSPLSTTTVFRHMPYNREIVSLLLEAEADLNYRERFYRPVHCFARCVCNIMRNPPALFRGIAENPGGTPVLIAAWFGNPEMVQILLDARADPTLRNIRNKTYLDLLHGSSCPSISHSDEVSLPALLTAREADELEEEMMSCTF